MTNDGRRRTLRWVALAVLLATTWPAAESRAQAATGDEAISRAVQDLHILINRHRASIGCPALRWHEGAARVAEAHSRDMAERDYFDHLTPDGLDLARRLLSGGIGWRGSIAENIAYTPAGAPSAFELWIDSALHRVNIEECAFTHHGIGLFRYRWTEVLLEEPTGAADGGAALAPTWVWPERHTPSMPRTPGRAGS